jgi:Protein of unknown function DUF262
VRTVPTNMTIADYCQGMQRKEIIVNNEYQRSDKVWPPPARSYLIETVLQDFPIPKLSLHQKTDVKSRRIIKEIVDGQQRSRAILDFYEDKFALTKSVETSEWVGLRFSSMEDALQQQFLDYQLSIDLFTAASDAQVREMFRRMNSYTIPLNQEEQRHAKWQGLFKWFVHRISRRYDEAFLILGLFAEKGLVRMQDTKLITEVCRALTNGLETTKATPLDEMYRLFDEQFPQSEEFELRLTTAFDQLLQWKDLHKTSLMKPHVAYALLLALIHVRRAVPKLQEYFPSPNLSQFDESAVLARLTGMAEALDASEDELSQLTPTLRDFVAGSETRTNVKTQRQKRFVSFCHALTTSGA